MLPVERPEEHDQQAEDEDVQKDVLHEPLSSSSRSVWSKRAEG
jgi:hypothetical protein